MKIKKGSLRTVGTDDMYCMEVEDLHTFVIESGGHRFIVKNCMQNEWAGAQAFNSFDTYLSPFVIKDEMTDAQIKQCLQTFCWDIETPFTLADGSSITFRQAQERGLEEADVLSYDEESGKVVKAHADHIGWRQDNVEMIEIELEDGTVQRCDLEQPILTSNRGWIRAKDLGKDDDMLEV